MDVETKDWIAIAGIAITFLVSLANFLYSIYTNKRTSFVNTVTSSRLKWIDSLRDKVSEYIAVATRLSHNRPALGESKAGDLLLQRDSLLHQIVLHLNPHDKEDLRIKELAERIRTLTEAPQPSEQLQNDLSRLRDATADYLKKEWNRVKAESIKGNK